MQIEPVSRSTIEMPAARTEFDGWRSVSIALYMSLLGYAVLVGIPVISTAWVELLGFSEEQVGRVAGADLGGLSLGAVLASLVVGRMDRRWLTVVGALLAMAGNGLCMLYQGYESVLWLRGLAGLGAGIYTAVAVATLGGTAKPTRAFNIMLFAFAFSQALELKVLPMLSMNGIYGSLIGCYVFGLLFLGWLPARPSARAPVGDQGTVDGPLFSRIPAYIPWLALGAIFLTYINIGSYWTYVELAALDAGLDGDYVGALLVWVSLFSFLGCLVATLISNRFGLARPLLLSLILMTTVVGMLSGAITNTTLLVSLFSFNLLWIFVDVYQMATVANLDRSGAFASLMPGAQGLGQIVGPNLAASMIGAGMGYGSVFLMCAAAAFAGMVVYAVMHARLKAFSRRQPPVPPPT